MRYPFATFTQSPNFTPGRVSEVDRVVIHQTDGQPLFNRCVAHLCNPAPDNGHRVSAHFAIGQAGASEVAQLVDTVNTAWHCTKWNPHSIGIEHVARTPGELSATDQGLALTEPQLQVSARLVAWLLDQYKLPVEAVVPHCAYPATTHLDCGKNAVAGGIWPWARYLDMVREASAALARLNDSLTPDSA